MIDAHQLVDSLGRRQMMADRANPAKPLYQHRQFPIGPPLDKAFETAKLDDVQPRLPNMVILVQQQCDLAVAFDPSDRFNDDSLEVFGIDGGFKMFVHERRSGD